MNGKTGVGIVLTLCLLGLKVILKTSRHSGSRSTFSSSYGGYGGLDGYGAGLEGCESRRLESEAAAARRAPTVSWLTFLTSRARTS